MNIQEIYNAANVAISNCPNFQGRTADEIITMMTALGELFALRFEAEMEMKSAQ